MSYSTPPASRKQFTISDGRAACGIVEQSSIGFVAFDITGKIVGTFQTLREASRSLAGGSSA